ncbi:hypothetical protein J3F83DRAFT_726952 [Trichoderma novae-zelandiae]
MGCGAASCSPCLTVVSILCPIRSTSAWAHEVVRVSAGTRHIMIISYARELGPSGHINGSRVRHEIVRHRASDQPRSGTLGRQTGRPRKDLDTGSHSPPYSPTTSHQYQNSLGLFDPAQHHDISSRPNPFTLQVQ